MTRIWLGAALVMLFASCGKSLEEKANALIKENMTKVLYHPESYDPVETRIDSAFTPFDDPVFFEKTLQLYKLNMSIDEYDRNMKRAKYSMSICGDSYMSAYVRNRYQESKDEYDQNAQDKEIAEKKARKLVDELETVLRKEPRFIGFKAWHRCRVKNDAGEIGFVVGEYLFEKDVNRIVAAYDMDSGEYKAVHMIYEQMNEEDEPVDVKDLGDDEEELEEEDV